MFSGGGRENKLREKSLNDLRLPISCCEINAEHVPILGWAFPPSSPKLRTGTYVAYMVLSNADGNVSHRGTKGQENGNGGGGGGG